MLWLAAGAFGPSPDRVLSLYGLSLLICEVGIPAAFPHRAVIGVVRSGDREIGATAVPEELWGGQRRPLFPNLIVISYRSDDILPVPSGVSQVKLKSPGGGREEGHMPSPFSE